jgi:pimeloyl-ACP methyl ester carboxylesterase
MPAPPPAPKRAFPRRNGKPSSAARRWLAGLLLPFQALLSACLCPRPVTVPVRSASYPARKEGRSARLVILLPGLHSRGEDFERKGFVSLAREAGIDADLAAVDLHYGYYKRGIFQQRLWEDVLLPAKAAGYGEIWVVGISMGGSGALGLASRHADSLRGIVLLSPFLGPPQLAEEIGGAGGLARWSPEKPGVSDPFEAFFRSLWGWLKDAASPEWRGPPVYLGFGREDRMAPSLEVLAAALPPDRVLRLPGGHDWKTWRSLWKDLLSREVWPRISSGKEPAR